MENVEKLIYELKINYVESLDTSDLYTPEHKKYNCEIANKKGAYRFIYQCNPKYHKITKESLLACVINDSQCYTSCLVGDDEDNIQEFAIMFGYDNNFKELIRVYKGCKKAYSKLSEMFSDDELGALYDYLSEKGEI